MAPWFISREKLSVASVYLLLSLVLGTRFAQAVDVPLVSIAHGAFNEKVEAVWTGVEQGFFRKHGVEVQVINVRSGPQTIAALASGDIQVACIVPGSVLSAVAGGMDVAFFGGIVNRADGNFVVEPRIRQPEDLRGKRLGVQAVGGGTWSLAMLALENLGLDTTRDQILVMVVGDQSVLTKAMVTGQIDAAYLGYTFSTVLKEKGFRVLLDIGKAPIPYQGLALVARRSYLQQNPQIADSVLRGAVESVAFIQNPANREFVLKSLAKHLRLTNSREVEKAYEVLQWLYNLDIRPNLKGIQNVQRLLAVTNPKVMNVRAEEVVDEEPVRRLEKSSFYRELIARIKK